MRKIIGLFLALTLVFSIAQVEVHAASCADGGHQWNSTGKCQVAECQAQCGHETYTVKVHDCTKGGYDTKICSICPYKGPLDFVNHGKTSHNFENNVCTECGAEKEITCTEGHTYPMPSDGICSECGESCGHDNQSVNYGNCTDLSKYVTTRCDDCKMNISIVPVSGEHDMVEGVCTKCGYEEDTECEHEWNSVSGLCEKCGADCGHEEKETIYGLCTDPNAHNTTRCKECKKLINTEPVSGEHDMVDDVCTRCGYKEDPNCEHSWDRVTGLCEKCGKLCDHPNTKIVHADCEGNGHVTEMCTECLKVLNVSPVPGKHTFEKGVCVKCGAKDPNYKPSVNNKDEEESATLVEVVTYEAVAPKTGDNANTMMAAVIMVFAGAAVVVLNKKRKTY